MEHAEPSSTPTFDSISAVQLWRKSRKMQKVEIGPEQDAPSRRRPADDALKASGRRSFAGFMQKKLLALTFC
jgi:hypothetical protein